MGRPGTGGVWMTVRIAILGIFVIDATFRTLRLPRMGDFRVGRNECHTNGIDFGLM